MGERIWEEDDQKKNATMEPNILHDKKLEKILKCGLLTEQLEFFINLY